MKEDRHQQASLPDRQGQWRRADHNHLRNAPRRGQRQLTEVEAHGGRRIEVQIDVVHGVEAPQRRNAVGEDVPHIERVVHEQHRGRHFQPYRQPQRFNRPQRRRSTAAAARDTIGISAT